jgi:hypothetical protein
LAKNPAGYHNQIKIIIFYNYRKGRLKMKKVQVKAKKEDATIIPRSEYL